MLYKEDIAKEIALKLLQIKAIKLEPTNPFTWASGMKSPIYCDNRSSLSYPDIRSLIKTSLAEMIRQEFPDAESIVGVATAGIPHGALIADELGLPFAYVRAKAKEHGMGNQIEGRLEAKSKVVVIEDLVSTGKSSLAVVNTLKDLDVEVLGMGAIFTYAFDIADEAFSKADCKLVTLSDYHELLKIAVDTEYVAANQIEVLSQWRNDPKNWQANTIS